MSDGGLAAKSITHKHITSVLLMELERFMGQSDIRILDAGCGNCELIGYLHRALRILQPDLNCSVYGYDVNDRPSEIERAKEAKIAELGESFPETEWQNRIKVVSSVEKLPFDAEFFDVVVSNQVLEHVADPDFFFSETHRILKPHGFAVHLYPLKNYILEGHIFIPFAHRIRDHRFRVEYLKFMMWLGLGQYRQKKRERPDLDLDTFAIYQADYLNLYTNYMSRREAMELAKKYRFRASLNYTVDMYLNKIREILGLEYRFTRNQAHLPGFDGFATFILKYVSSITLFLDKQQIYDSHKDSIEK